MAEHLFRVSAKACIIVDGNVLLVHDDPSQGREGYWDLPGGGIEPGEALMSALVREVTEELGFRLPDANPAYPLLRAAIPALRHETAWGTRNYLMLIYEVRLPAVPRVTLSDEHDRYAWCAPDEAARRLMQKYDTQLHDYFVHL